MRRILIIDAIPTRRIVMKAKLGAAQYDVVVAADAREADQHIRTMPFDVIFADRHLDGPGGALGLCSTLKSDTTTQHVPLVMITDALADQDVLDALAAGYDDVIRRPLSERVLLAQLRALMRRQNGADQNGEQTYLRDMPDTAAKVTRPTRLAIVASSLNDARHCAGAIADAVSSPPPPQIMVQDHAGILTALRAEPELDTVLLMVEPGREEAALTLLSDLRSRGAARGAGLILAMDPKQPTYVARAFDLGADYVVSCDANAKELRIRAELLAKIKLQDDALRLKVRDGLRMAITDPLTGVYNRRFATEKLGQIARKQEEFAVLMLDLDHFKKINDLHGHGVGDQVLATIARALKANLRDTDMLARIGGEEFLIALPGATPAQAIGTAERLRQVIDETKIKAPATGRAVRVTSSIGLVHNDGRAPSIEVLMAKADEALYCAKSHGRNMVSVSAAA
ncbi:diguanylate cyclase [uncultured Litoreibacter sp.]|uniref:diguanylate cyclase n=1 Tax=uncultured Litoreibacter sp. TaxID=1392394 RepID=UPI002629F552|nr:diguanylate cyclase [uncultured Litoreibacter sp.]